jgi:hypothetical protein
MKSNNKSLIKRYLQQNTYETYILEKLIIKTGALLAVMFGQAGSNIIAENISKNDTLNPMIAGKKVMAIYGFCNIRQFSTITEILQEDVMMFVNEIALIIHSSVHQNHGSANK